MMNSSGGTANRTRDDRQIQSKWAVKEHTQQKDGNHLAHASCEGECVPLIV